MWPWSRKPRSTGQHGEDLAAAFLKRKGYTLLQRNAWQGKYEIDIVARDRDATVFVEVRTLSVGEGIRPEDTVAATKQRHIRLAARHYIQQHRLEQAHCRFDVVAVILSEKGRPEITHYEDAFHDR